MQIWLHTGTAVKENPGLIPCFVSAEDLGIFSSTP